MSALLYDPVSRARRPVVNRDGSPRQEPENSFDHLLLANGARPESRFQTHAVAVIRPSRSRWNRTS